MRGLLLRLRAANKRLFIVTNSPLWYLAPQLDLFVGEDWRSLTQTRARTRARARTRYIAPQLDLFVGEDWRSLFELVVVSARKPAWFAEGQDTISPLREVRADGTLATERVDAIQPNAVYANGCVDEVMALTGWAGQP